MKWYKVLIGLFSLVLLVIILDVGVNRWLKYKLPAIINRKNDAAYFVTFKELKVSFWNNTVSASKIIIVPKAAIKDSINKNGIYAQIAAVEVRDLSIWNVLFSDKIKAKSIDIERPMVVLYKEKWKTNIRESVVAPFEKIITVSDVFLHHGDLKIIYIKKNTAIFNVYNINLKLDGILITDKILDRKIPFEFKNYSVSCDSMYYHPNVFYDIRTKKINATNTDLSIDHFEMLPKYSRREFVAKIPKEEDLFTVLCKSITVSRLDWGFKADDFFFHCNTVALEGAAANIYRSKEPPDDLRKKYLYNKLLRDLKFDLKVDTLTVRNSILEHDVENSADIGAGKLVFNNFNVTATSICSGFKKKKLPDLKIKVKCRFMNASPLNVNWKFNVMDKSDGFNINGTLTNFDAAHMALFTKSLINVKTQGVIDEVHFNFTGNDKRDSGKFGIKYDDLKFTVYRKDDRKKKNKLLTFLAGIVVKKDTGAKVKEVHVELERIPEKSFYNFLWRSIAEGLKKVLV